MLGEDVFRDAVSASAQVPTQPRVALLKLQLRAALREAAEAEAAEQAIDIDAAVAELHERLEPLFVERRRMLEQTMAAERVRADTAVVAARRAATVMIEQARAAQAPVSVESLVTEQQPAEPLVMEPLPVESLVTEPQPVEPLVLEPLPVESLVAEPQTAEPLETEVLPPEPLDEAIAELPIIVAATMESESPLDDVFDIPLVPEVDPDGFDAVHWAGQLPPPPPIASPAHPATTPVGQPTNMVIDPEGFARLIANMVVAIVDERTRVLGAPPAMPFGAPQPMQQVQPVQYVLPPQFIAQAAPAPAAPAAKGSFWKHLWHADVLLLGITTVIVIVVLAAWLG